MTYLIYCQENRELLHKY
jgi:hypothetical protein